MNVMIKKYAKSVGRRLHCLPETRKKLLAGLEQELRELSEQSTASMSALAEDYGSIANVAAELQACVSEEEFEKWVKRRNTALWVTAIAAAVVIVLSLWYVGYVFSNWPMYVVETIK